MYEVTTIREFCLDLTKEALSYSVVETVALPGHRLYAASPFHEKLPLGVLIMQTLVGVDDGFVLTKLIIDIKEHAKHHIHARSLADSLGDDLTVVKVDKRGEINFGLADLKQCKITHELLERSVGFEVALQVIIGNPSKVVH